jgi:hypothetical protein
LLPDTRTTAGSWTAIGLPHAIGLGIIIPRKKLIELMHPYVPISDSRDRATAPVTGAGANICGRPGGNYNGAARAPGLPANQFASTPAAVPVPRFGTGHET